LDAILYARWKTNRGNISRHRHNAAQQNFYSYKIRIVAEQILAHT